MRDVVRSGPRLLAKRSRIQRLRARADAELLISGPIYMGPDRLNKPLSRYAMRALSWVFAGYWALARRLV
jgi:hypothetical protein